MSNDNENKSLLYTPEDIELFKEFYLTNEDCYAEQMPPNENNKVRWNKIERQGGFCEDLIKHFEGTKTLGAYTIILSGEKADHCKNCTFDFDLDIALRKDIKSVSDESKRDEEMSSALIELENKVRDFIFYLNSVGIPNDKMLVSFSGYKGYHVDLFFASPLPTRKVYEFANLLKRSAGLPSNLEVFPKQPTAGGAYGSLVKLPLGVHQLTKKRAKFLDLFDSDVSTFGTPFDFLRRTKKLDLDDIMTVMSNISEAQINVGTYDSFEEIKDISLPPTCASLSDMMSKCNALKRIEKKAKKEKHLLHEERLSLLMLCMHFGEKGRERLHSIISNCTDYSKEETDKMLTHAKDHKKYRPITCARMQDMHVCAKNCQEILARDGLSPIKLAYPKAKVDVRLEFVEDAEKDTYRGKFLSVPFKVDSEVGGSYSVPKECHFTCSETCPGRVNPKFNCEYENKSGVKKVIIPADSEIVLACLDIPTAQLKRTIMSMTGVYCLKPQHMQMKVVSDHHIQPIMISSADEVIRNSVFTSKTTMESKAYLSYFNGDNINVATDYIGFGRLHPHPKSQRTTYLFSRVERMMGNLDRFSATEEQLKLLQQFKETDKSWLASTLADQVAGIRGRDREALVVLLTMMSPLQIEFNGKMLDRGWLEVCFIGDSAQGKSYLPEKILAYCGTLNKVSGGNTTSVGLVGGVDKHDGHQFISWGVLPNSDKTIVFMDEIEKLQKNTEAFAALREIRTSGKAVITKIRKGSKLCRVRIIASANPQHGLSMDAYKRGCQAIASIMEPPDARRFDLFQFFFTGEVDVDVALKECTVTECEVSKDMMRTALLWAWTREASDIKFTPEVTREVLIKAKKLMKKYQAASVTLPLITMDTPDKLARVTAAFASLNMRTDDFEKVTPTLDDVELAYALYDSTYGHKRVGLDEEARECERKYTVQDDWFNEFQCAIRQHDLMKNLSLTEVVTHLNTLEKLRADEIAMYFRTSRTEMVKVLQLFAVENLVVADSGGVYIPTTKLHKLAYKLKHSGDDRQREIDRAIIESTQTAEGGDMEDVFG